MTHIQLPRSVQGPPDSDHDPTRLNNPAGHKGQSQVTKICDLIPTARLRDASGYMTARNTNPDPAAMTQIIYTFLNQSIKPALDLQYQPLEKIAPQNMLLLHNTHTQNLDRMLTQVQYLARWIWSTILAQTVSRVFKRSRSSEIIYVTAGG